MWRWGCFGDSRRSCGTSGDVIQVAVVVLAEHLLHVLLLIVVYEVLSDEWWVAHDVVAFAAGQERVPIGLERVAADDVAAVGEW